MLRRPRLARSLVAALSSLLPLAPAAGQALDTAAVDRVFSAYDRTGSPGCGLGIYRDGRIAYARGYGMADLDHGVAITPSTIFDIGSTSKQFTAAAVTLLVLDGTIAWTDNVRTYVPEVPDYGTPITIEHLVRHISGLRDYIGVMFMAGHRSEDATTAADALAAISRQRALNFPPGSRWAYSNSGFFLLSTIVERVTKKTMAEFAGERIFGPLGMTHTRFRDDHTAIYPGRAVAYGPAAGGGFRIDMSDWDQTGDGAVNTSIEDLIRWDENFYRPEVGGPALVEQLVAPGTLNDGRPHGYGRGLFLDSYRGLRRVHHGGSWAGYRAMLMRFPSRHTSIAVLCNLASANTQGLSEQVADLVLAGDLAARDEPAPEAAGPAGAVNAARYAGLFFSEADQAIASLAGEGGGLALGALGRTIPLHAAGAGRFRAEGFPLEVEALGPPAGPTDSIALVLLGERSGTYVRVTRADPSSVELEALAGTYFSPELDTDMDLVVRDGRLHAESRAIDSEPLTPAMKDAFYGDSGFLRFTRDRAGRVTGFELSASRMLRLRFDRRR